MKTERKPLREAADVRAIYLAASGVLIVNAAAAENAKLLVYSSGTPPKRKKRV